MKLTASKMGESGIVETREWNDYLAHAKWDDLLEVEWLGKTFVAQDGTDHTIVGYKTRARRRPASSSPTVTERCRPPVHPSATQK